MKIARYVSKLIDDRERNFETKIALKNLLNPNNLLVISNHVKEGTGEYPDLFPDDMAISHTLVTFKPDNAGRPFFELDVCVVKFMGEDRDLILSLLQREYAAKLAQQRNGGELHNPLEEVKL